MTTTRSGRVNTVEELISDYDAKGYFVESCIYDFFENSNYEVSFVGTEIKNKEVTFQRMKENYGIIVPDLLCQNKYKEILFIESKSRWLNADKYGQSISDRKIKKETFESYLKFQDEVFSKSERISVSAQILICFSTVRYSINENRGEITCNFVRLNDFRKLRHGSEKEENKTSYIWREPDVLETSFKIKKIDFSYDEWSEIFSNKFCKDIYGKQRNNFKVTEKSMKKLMNEWIWCA